MELPLVFLILTFMMGLNGDSAPVLSTYRASPVPNVTLKRAMKPLSSLSHTNREVSARTAILQMLDHLYSWPPPEQVPTPVSSIPRRKDADKQNFRLPSQLSPRLTFPWVLFQIPEVSPSADTPKLSHSALPLLSTAAATHTHKEAVDGDQATEVYVTIVLASVTPKPNGFYLPTETNNSGRSGSHQWPTPEHSSVPFIDQDLMTTGQLLKKLAVEEPEPSNVNAARSMSSPEPTDGSENGTENGNNMFAGTPEPSIMYLVPANLHSSMIDDDAGNTGKGREEELVHVYIDLRK